jgi:hypothetical protein
LVIYDLPPLAEKVRKSLPSGRDVNDCNLNPKLVPDGILNDVAVIVPATESNTKAGYVDPVASFLNNKTLLSDKAAMAGKA